MALSRKLVGFINFCIGLPITFYLFPPILWYWNFYHLYGIPLLLGGTAGVFGLFGGWRLLRGRKQFRLPLACSGLLWLLVLVTAYGNLPVIWAASFAILGNLNLIMVGLDLRFRRE